MLKPETFNVGYVIWSDANFSTSPDNLHHPRHEPVTLLSAGVIVEDSKKGVTIAQDFGEDGGFRETKFIPRVCIQDVQVLEKNVVSRSPQWAMMPKPKKRRRK